MTEILYFSFVFNDNDPFLIFLPIRLFVFDSGDFCSLSLVILHVFCYFGFAVHESSRVTKDIWSQYQDRWLRFKRKTLHALGLGLGLGYLTLIHETQYVIHDTFYMIPETVDQIHDT